MGLEGVIVIVGLYRIMEKDMETTIKGFGLGFRVYTESCIGPRV